MAHADDSHNQAIFLYTKETGRWNDKSAEIKSITLDDPSTYSITFENSNKPYSYHIGRVFLANPIERILISPGTVVEVEGVTWPTVTKVAYYSCQSVNSAHIYYQTKDGPIKCTVRPKESVRIVPPLTNSSALSIFAYFKAIANALPDVDGRQDPTKAAYNHLSTVHPESALASYLSKTLIRRTTTDFTPIFPFGANTSQMKAIANALTTNISIIEGPPGTGKTQTILNLLATLTAKTGVSVGMVSVNNSAVQNVADKLEEEGFGFVTARLGNETRQKNFFDSQAKQAQERTRFLSQPLAPVPTTKALQQEQETLQRSLENERTIKQLTQQLDALTLEREHLVKLLDRQKVNGGLEKIPLASRSSQRILDFLVEEQLRRRPMNWAKNLYFDVRRYFRYGPTKNINPDSSDSTLMLQLCYFDKLIEEITEKLNRMNRGQEKSKFEQNQSTYTLISKQFYTSCLRDRYSSRSVPTYSKSTYNRNESFRGFIHDYPVLLSTCHSLRRNLPTGFLLDYLIIDEASEANLPVACLALSCCKNVVIVGDQKQLAPIVDKSIKASRSEPPQSEYNYKTQSILSSAIELYGEDSDHYSLLCEHYRCEPDIIGFCNAEFYDNKLITYTRHNKANPHPLEFWTTAPGNHMRHFDTGGTINQREAQVITNEILKADRGDLPTDYAVITPYRMQANMLSEMLNTTQIGADTVHRYQGRQQSKVIMSTVVDESRDGHIRLDFIDDPKLINVAVSRAKEQFILVTDYDGLPKSKYIRDLIGYIAYHDSSQDIMRSDITSVFDLLYSKYSENLQRFASQVHGNSPYKSENIGLTLVESILQSPEYLGLAVVPQVLVRSVLKDFHLLNPRELTFVKHNSSFDLLVYNKVTRLPILAIEIDGWKFHANNAEQQKRDLIKDAICKKHGLKLVRLSTIGSGEEKIIRLALDEALVNAVRGSLLLNPLSSE